MNKKEETKHLKAEYSSRIEKINQQLIEMQGKLILHQEAFDKDNENYAFIADLDRIEFLLSRINKFIKY